jgi:hypothetical protein
MNRVYKLISTLFVNGLYNLKEKRRFFFSKGKKLFQNTELTNARNYDGFSDIRMKITQCYQNILSTLFRVRWHSKV